MKKTISIAFFFFAINAVAIAAKCKAWGCPEPAEENCGGYCLDHCDPSDGYSSSFFLVLFLSLSLSILTFLYWWWKRKRTAIRVTA